MSQTLHLGSAEISRLFDMPLRVVQHVRQVWNEIGEVCRQRARSGRARLMSREAVDVCYFRTIQILCAVLTIVQMMIRILEHSPDLYLDEIQEQLSAVHGLQISIMTIS
jgi:hypothetical protein